jgi:hypothetical protein
MRGAHSVPIGYIGAARDSGTSRPDARNVDHNERST